jgi:hypothetical protein
MDREKTVEAVILTKSSKNGGYCVAGIDTNTGDWVRFVSCDQASHGALTYAHLVDRNGELIVPFDVVIVPIEGTAPLAIQPENVLIDETRAWEKIGVMTIDEVLQLHGLEHPLNLLGNEYSYITEPRVRTVGYSLTIVQVKDLCITHPQPYKTKATFFYGLERYEGIAVTDRDYYNAPDGLSIEKAYLVMSLPDAPIEGTGNNKYYKFIAKIIA